MSKPNFAELLNRRHTLIWLKDKANRLAVGQYTMECHLTANLHAQNRAILPVELAVICPCVGCLTVFCLTSSVAKVTGAKQEMAKKRSAATTVVATFAPTVLANVRCRKMPLVCSSVT